jgi:hypothetical protein
MPEAGALIQTSPLGGAPAEGKQRIAMPTVHEMFPAKFLSQTDLTSEIWATVDSIEQMDVSGGNDPKFEWVIRFHDNIKPLLLTYPLALIFANILGTDDAAQWGDRRVVLYWDPNVYFAGRLMGAIRPRVPIGEEPAAPKPRRAERRAS